MAYEAELAGLTRASSMGSKLVIGGTTAAVTSALVVFLIRTGQDPDAVTIFGVNLPARIAVIVFAILSGTTGWAFVFGVWSSF